MHLDLLLAVLGLIVVALAAASFLLQRISVPAPLVALVLGVLAGPSVLHLVDVGDLGIGTNTLLRESARLTLAVGLAGVALRLPHGYWRKNVRWVASMIGVGMIVMFAIATGLIWLSVGGGLVFALRVRPAAGHHGVVVVPRLRHPARARDPRRGPGSSARTASSRCSSARRCSGR